LFHAMRVANLGVSRDSARMQVWQAGLWFPLFSFSSISMVLLNKFCATSFREHFSLLG